MYYIIIILKVLKKIFLSRGTLLESSICTFSYIFMYVRGKRGEFHEFHMVILLWLRPGYRRNPEFSSGIVVCQTDNNNSNTPTGIPLLILIS